MRSSGASAGRDRSGRGLCRCPHGRPAGVPLIMVEPPADTGIMKMMFLIGVGCAGVGVARGRGSALDQVPVPVAEGGGRELGGLRDRAELLRILKVRAVQPDHVLAGHPV